MPQYTLQVLDGNNGTMVTTVYTINVTGASASGVDMKYKAPSDNGWTDFTPQGSTNQITFTPAGTHPGTPASPNTGDTLTLQGTVATANNPSYSLSGSAVYDPPGSNGNGYFRVPGVTATEGDWAAQSN